MSGTGPALTKPSDGPVSLLINRRVSALLSAPLARAGVSPNVATLLALLIAAGASAAYALQLWWAGGLLLQLSSIFAGVDGEIARRTDRATRFGDFLDTVTDRMAEYAAFVAIAFGLAQTDRWEVWAWPVGLFALGGTFMLAVASEKYRSVQHENYPKRQWERAFAYLSSGRDVRVFYLAVASVLATVSADVLFWALVAVAAVTHLNLFYRVLVIRSRIDG